MNSKVALVTGACFLLTAVFLSFAESRGRHYTEAELLEQSTFVFKGQVLEVEVLDEYKVSFPTKATVATVLKGKWGHKEIAFKHKSPGKNVIYEQEFNRPEKGQKGTFYLKAEYENLVLIGYIRETEPNTEGDGLKPAP